MTLPQTVSASVSKGTADVYTHTHTLPSPHLSEYGAFPIHPKNGFKRGLCCIDKLKAGQACPLGLMSDIVVCGGCIVNNVGFFSSFFPKRDM